ncbi:MAG: metallophosphoesterase [Actinomycetota bacterium]|nr:metallophosphoesterase [Actinomycetota bacterium]
MHRADGQRTRRRLIRLAPAGAALAAAAAGVAFGASTPSVSPSSAPTALTRSFVPPARGAAPTVWAVGDGANGSANARRLANQIARARPARFLYLGDVYADGTAEEYAEHYRPVYGRLDRITAPTPGNHEWSNHEEGYDPYWRRARRRPVPPYYATRVGRWQLLSLNSEIPHGEGSPQLRWLRATLRRARGTCRLAFWHRPRFSAGTHGDQGDTAPMWDALRGHAVLVLGAHDHNLQRFRPIDGMVQLVVGAGGKERYDVDADDRRLAFADDDRWGAVRLRLGRRSARFAFVALGGRRLDRGRVGCRPLR